MISKLQSILRLKKIRKHGNFKDPFDFITSPNKLYEFLPFSLES